MTARASRHRALAVVEDRPSSLRLLGAQLVHSTRELWRARVVFVLTFLMPLTWLVVFGFLAGNEVVDEATGVRLMQFVTPSAAVLGVLYAAFPTVAIALAVVREDGVLKRIRGTPLPAWIYFLGRIGAAVVFAVVAVVTMIAFGVVAYDVQVLWRTAAASFVTLAVGLACFVALGLAVGTLAPSSTMAEAAAISVAVVLAFLSGVFTVGVDLPVWADRTAEVFPLKPFADAMTDQFDPYGSGGGWDLPALAVMIAWGVGGTIVATLFFRWEPHSPRRGARREGERASSDGVAAPAAVTAPPRGAQAVEAGRPGPITTLLDQVRWTGLATWREPGWVFFAVGMPVGIYAFMLSLGVAEAIEGDQPLNLALAAGMTTWGAAVSAFVNLPGVVADAREGGVLKRLRSTPLNPVFYLAGRTLSAVLVGILTGVLVVPVGLVFFDLRISWSGLPLAAGLVVLGSVTFAACGFALAAALPNSQALAAVGLTLLLPLAFVSDVFPTGELPEWMSTVGSLLPLKHVSNGVAAALDPSGPTVHWTGLGVLALWLIGSGVVAVRSFRWEPRTRG